MNSKRRKFISKACAGSARLPLILHRAMLVMPGANGPPSYMEALILLP